MILTELMALLGAIKKMMRMPDLGPVSGAAIVRSEGLLYVAGRVGVYDPSLHAGSQWYIDCIIDGNFECLPEWFAHLTPRVFQATLLLSKLDLDDFVISGGVESSVNIQCMIS